MQLPREEVTEIAQKIREIMTSSPITLTADRPVTDLAMEGDQESALADVSAARANNQPASAELPGLTQR